VATGQVVLNTERLVLRPWTIEDAPAGLTIFGREEVTHWLTNTSATAVRYHYSEGHSGAEPTVSHGRIGVAVFAHDFQTIRPLAERDNTNIVYWSELDTGGHYAALEVPELVVGDLRTFFSDSGVRE